MKTNIFYGNKKLRGIKQRVTLYVLSEHTNSMKHLSSVDINTNSFVGYLTVATELAEDYARDNGIGDYTVIPLPESLGN